MSHIRDSPEFRLARSDSKDPATTCRGLTADGRPCRRSVVSKAKSSTTAADRAGSRTTATTATPTTSASNHASRSPEELFCWQHQSQALDTSLESKRAASKLKNRSSLDTLVERTGLLTLEDESRQRREKARLRSGRNTTSTYNNRPSQRHSTTITTTATAAYGTQGPRSAPEGYERLSSSFSPKTKRKSSSARRKLVCFITHVSDDELADLRMRRRAGHATAASSAPAPVARTPPGYRSRIVGQAEQGRLGRREDAVRPSSSRCLPAPQKSNPRPLPAPSPVGPSPSGTTTPGSQSSRTQSLLSWIPPDLSPETTSKLLQKLSEPLSSAEEPGYIYIYCITPPNSTPSPEAASALIPPPHTTAPSRRTSDILRSAGISANKTRKSTSGRSTNTITLKIGRAVNVSRRLTQQCAHNLTLVRYYPYSPSNPDAPPPRKVPNVHRLERLIHIELGDLRVKLEEPCELCGKRHQEYFEIEAEKENLRRVDECVRRWVRFSEQNPFR
ncbi:hypothetical protein VTO42DRAFT_3222 [Malbranchea cinnamomea]